jgi:hypothetical protein
VLPPAVAGGLVQVHSRSDAPTTTAWTRVGPVDPRAAVRYLAVWAAALCAVLLVVLVLGYALLTVLGVTGSVSKALAIVSGDDATASGLVPALQPQHVLPLLVVGSVVLSGLAFVAALAGVLVHNAATSLTGGLRVRMRPEKVRPIRPRHSSGGGS